MFSLTRSNLLRQLPDLSEIIRRLTVNRGRYSFNRNMFLAAALEVGADAIINIRWMTTSVVGSAAELLVYARTVRVSDGFET
ncbi:MAG: hypothetical protein JRE65_18385 [Deltaproteobacteria bacterium]|jgi:hypothetical protein|nr:hypothetical protein [Deltaproteobacteria bacterium]